ncbi:putative transglutaminase-like cysteine proteinase [Rhizobium aethiopicum]|uniref:Putative transglutaminase-like cysteine proteinase n=1 Tax=Rhizobium aethiopicum TaxID=1138170 RepID=A0A7W6QCQ6_9HYPH|nr:MULTISPECIES: transglutaminase-like cysteine peptidase [Rhizobium]MBB4195124.1 putative transglutaminase-like cysteine proteinase [Rhizobium aethiopicum]MBB4582683.1 putative transglutaminase-like cysteine proteinase [Rhizobium aethiopicum]MDO3436025.1 transglutaminase-like cysteine peptidase [Rhizobium sp. CBN3]
MTAANILKGGLLASAIMMAMAGSGQATPASMALAGNASPPIGHYEFCKANPTECTYAGGDAGPAVLTEDRWKEILKVNYTVNSSIQPETDEQIYGVEERWAYPTTVGDCEDYALLKRKMLIEDGFSPSDTLITVVLQPNGEGHAVLTVRTDHGDFILDNMRNKVLLWSDTEYTYLKRQSASDPARWSKLQDGRAVAVGSVR